MKTITASGCMGLCLSTVCCPGTMYLSAVLLHLKPVHHTSMGSQPHILCPITYWKRVQQLLTLYAHPDLMASSMHTRRSTRSFYEHLSLPSTSACNQTLLPYCTHLIQCALCTCSNRHVPERRLVGLALSSLATLRPWLHTWNATWRACVASNKSS